MSSSLKHLLLRTRHFHQICAPLRTCARTLSTAPCCSYRRNVHRETQPTHCLYWNLNNITSKLYFHARSYTTQHGAETLSMKDDLVRSYVKHLHEKYHEASRILTAGSAGAQLKVQEEAKKSRADLATVAELYEQYENHRQQREELKKMMEESGAEDAEMKRMLEKEMSETRETLSELDEQIMLHIVAPDFGDDSDIIMELMAGAGGQEAMLFTAEIYDMYEGFAAYKGWNLQIIDVEYSPLGGVRKASVSMNGVDVYKIMKYEGGVHRVQRIPKTEKTGRLHTSTMSVAVLPQPTEVDIVIQPGDLKIDTFRSSGAGGQHVNTTDSGVRITHKPSGTVVECQAGRSQIKNKEQAMTVLKTRLYDAEVAKQLEETQAKRKIQTGTRSRNEKIRTYNFNQDRITDHRLTENMYNLGGFMTGGEQLDEMIYRLMEASRLERLQEILIQFEKSSKP